MAFLSRTKQHDSRRRGATIIITNCTWTRIRMPKGPPISNEEGEARTCSQLLDLYYNGIEAAGMRRRRFR